MENGFYGTPLFLSWNPLVYCTARAKEKMKKCLVSTPILEWM